MYHIFFIHSLVEEHLGCFQVPAVTNNAAMNVVEQMSLWYECASFGYIPESGIAGSLGRLIPNFLRNYHTDFQSGYTSSHSHKQKSSYPDYTSSPAKAVLSIFGLSYSEWYKT